MNKEELKKFFKDYVYNFDMNDSAIIRKFYHSYRVMDLSMLIAKHTEIPEENIEIAEIAGLLHDYARFPQWEKYKTYSDIESIDHGDLAVELLFTNSAITQYCNNVKYYDEIFDAIKYHNKLSIPEHLSEHNKLLCEIIRDADKLDIFYLFGVNKDLILEDDDNISPEVEQDFYSQKSIDRRKIKNESDKILLDLAMVFDLNFDYSYKHLYDLKLIEKIYEGIENKEKYGKYFDYIIKYIKERID